jgi:hypothetical protein
MSAAPPSPPPPSSAPPSQTVATPDTLIGLITDIATNYQVQQYCPALVGSNNVGSINCFCPGATGLTGCTPVSIINGQLAQSDCLTTATLSNCTGITPTQISSTIRAFNSFTQAASAAYTNCSAAQPTAPISAITTCVSSDPNLNTAAQNLVSYINTVDTTANCSLPQNTVCPLIVTPIGLTGTTGVPPPIYIASFYPHSSIYGPSYNVTVPGTLNFTNGIFASSTLAPTSTYPSGSLPQFNLNTIHAIYIQSGFNLTINGTANGTPVSINATGPDNLVNQNFKGFTGSVIITQISTQFQEESGSSRLIWIILVIIIIILIVMIWLN